MTSGARVARRPRTGPVTFSAATMLAAVVSCLAGACNQGIEPGPVAIEATVAPQRQWSGARVTVRSPQLVGARAEDVVLTMSDQRYGYDQAYLIDADRVGEDGLEFTVPPLYSGMHHAILRIRGFEPATVSFDVVGQARPPQYLFGIHVEPHHVLPLPPRQALSAGSGMRGAEPDGYVVVDLATDTRRTIAGLEIEGPNIMKMYVPGPSYRPNHAVVDLSPADSTGAEVWQTSPTFRKVEPLECGYRTRLERWYTAAELAPGRCLVLTKNGQLMDQTGAVLAYDLGLSEGEIRLAPGGRWAIPVTRECCFDNPPELSTPVPVIARSGAVAYTLAGYVELPGADFSAEGDTLFVIGARRADGTGARTWSLDVLDAATGDPIGSIGFGSVSYMHAVLVDPVRPLLYVTGWSYNPAAHYDLQWMANPSGFLAVLDRETLAIVAVVPWVTYDSIRGRGDGWLMFGGSSGQIHFLPPCGGECGGIWDFVFDAN